MQAEFSRRLLNRTGSIVAISLIIALFVSLGAVMAVEIPASNHDIVLILITTLCNAVIGVTGYFFGTSASSSRERATSSDIIALQADTANKLADTAAKSSNGGDSSP